MNIKGDSELITKKFELNGTPYGVENFTAKLLDSNRKLIQNLDVTSPETGSYSFIITFPSNKEKVIVQYNYTENGIPKEEHWGISLTYYNGTIDFENDSTTPDLGWKHIHLNKEVIRPFIYMYVRLDFLYSSAFVDIMQKEPGKECEFENLGNWVKYPKRWEVRYRSFVRENLDKSK